MRPSTTARMLPDEHREEVVDARAPPSEAVQSLDVKRERHEHAEQRQHVDVLPEGRLSFRDRDEVGEPRLEPQQVGDDERRHPEHRVRDDVERHEEAVVPPHHGRVLAAVAGPSGDSGASREQPVSDTAALRSRRGTAPARTAARVRKRRLEGERAHAAQPVGECLGRGVEDEHAGRRRRRRSRRRLRCRAPRPDSRRPALRPGPCRSPRRRAGAWPSACRYNSRISSFDRHPRNVTSGPAMAWRRACSGPVPTIVRGAPSRRQASMATSRRLYGTSADTTRKPDRARQTVVSGTIKGCIYRRIHDGRLAIIVSADPLRNIPRVRHEAVDAAGGGLGPTGPGRP